MLSHGGSVIKKKITNTRSHDKDLKRHLWSRCNFYFLAMLPINSRKKLQIFVWLISAYFYALLQQFKYFVQIYAHSSDHKKYSICWHFLNMCLYSNNTFVFSSKRYFAKMKYLQQIKGLTEVYADNFPPCLGPQLLKFMMKHAYNVIFFKQTCCYI